MEMTSAQGQEITRKVKARYCLLYTSIHNYFFAKALDQVRPGGVVAFVTSRYTMDAKDSTVRRYLCLLYTSRNTATPMMGCSLLPENGRWNWMPPV